MPTDICIAETDPDFNPKKAKKLEKELKKMEKGDADKEKKGTKASSLAAKLSPRSQRKKEKLYCNTTQLKVATRRLASIHRSN